jgi:hypothetical protein
MRNTARQSLGLSFVNLVAFNGGGAWDASVAMADQDDPLAFVKGRLKRLANSFDVVQVSFVFDVFSFASCDVVRLENREALVGKRLHEVLVVACAMPCALDDGDDGLFRVCRHDVIK